MRLLFKKPKSFAEAKLSTLIVAGFPLVGKSYLTKLHPEEYIDSDSSQFQKGARWPANYLAKIMMEWDLGGSDKIILTSTHEEVLKILKEANLDYLVVIPKQKCLDEWIRRYNARKNNGFPLQKLVDNWDRWLNKIKSTHNNICELEADEYISNVFDEIS